MVDFFYLFIVVFIVMRHRKKGKSLGRNSSQRKSMFKNLMKSIIKHEIIKTTLPKAKEVRSTVERLITYGKKGDLHGIRLIAKTVKNTDLVMKLQNDIAPGYSDRNGGYTRILKLGPRAGDNAEMAIIELVDRVAKTEAPEVDAD